MGINIVALKDLLHLKIDKEKASAGNPTKKE
jgi:hypothetical protein